ncbi:MAG: riboflavin synthase [Gammaproteobacteria bacterium]|jgi:riboflavin synthase|nr:riboflavin synthase [Gammaproteobacteria bacterium]MBT4461985.1 riboflavin synthase [Gammaproteobacteria bacterium]MBT4654497.1 riboflavin synthase [Gammaproteobacteria bacterium]MBT5761438.1 riboflavin synthase [Gammaproteobacteria bacterium]MBT6332001.1 riboflavin synthase [Gammaproteobacteria bacterium]
MFTGIIENLGKVISINKISNNHVIEIEILNLPVSIANGDSIAINGACLTVSGINDNTYSFHLSPETMNKTSFNHLEKNNFVNTELPLTLNKFISGHITTGHIDTTGKIEKILKNKESWFVQLSIDSKFLKYVVHKGSICIDGVSLTINDMNENMLDLMIIPHTYENTIIKNYKINDNVNIEVDYIAKHLEKLKND